jgi:hypothetical protein
MKTDTIITLVIALVVIGFSWFLIKKLFFYALLAGGAYVGYKIFVQNSKKIEK